MKAVVLAVVICATLLACVNAQGNVWTTIKPNFCSIAPSIDFWDAQNGLISTFTNGPGPELLGTTDGAKTLTRSVPGVPLVIFADVTSLPGSNGQVSITTGVALGQSASVTTTNGGATWVKSNTTVRT